MDRFGKSDSAVRGREAKHTEAEFENFIASIGWSSVRRAFGEEERLESLPQPGSEAPSHPLRTRTRAASAGRAIFLVLCLILVAVVVLGVVFRHSLEDALMSRFGQGYAVRQERALAEDLLTHARFMSLLPGTSGDEVRARVGLPGSRGGASMLGGEQAWYYATVPAGRGGRPRVYMVTMSGGKVVRMLDITDLRSFSQMPDLGRQAPRYLGTLNVECGSEPVILTPSSNDAVLLVRSSCVIPEGSLPAVKMLRTERVSLEPPDVLLETSPVAVYWRGVLYPLAPPNPVIPASELSDDLKWLFRTLGCDETGRAIGEHP